MLQQGKQPDEAKGRLCLSRGKGKHGMRKGHRHNTRKLFFLQNASSAVLKCSRKPVQASYQFYLLFMQQRAFESGCRYAKLFTFPGATVNTCVGSIIHIFTYMFNERLAIFG